MRGQGPIDRQTSRNMLRAEASIVRYAIFSADGDQLTGPMSRRTAEAALMTALEYGETDVDSFVGPVEE